MARTVAGRRDGGEERNTTPYPDRRAACSFCSVPPVNHDYCPGETHTNPGKKDDKVWACRCWKEGHPR